MKRRDLLKAGILAGAAASLSARAQSAQANQPGILTRARNLIFFAYDGMGWEDYAIAQFYSRQVLGKPLALERFLASGVSGLQNTNSLTSFVTESSAAGNAWSTGVKTVNGGLAIHIDGRKLTPIFALAKQQGKAVGVVTTATVTHATPASFLVSNPDRNAEEEIAQQYLEFGAEVYLGGGQRFFDPAVRRDKRDMYAEFAAKGYGVVKTLGELRASNASKLLGVFSSSHVPYEADRRFQGVNVPSLADMTRAALPRLAAYSKGFVLQVEAARIDHANHLNDPAGSLWDILAADEALEVVMNFVDQNPDTLLIIGSDHACGAPALYGAGPSYRESSAGVLQLEAQKGTFEFMLARLGNNPTPDQVVEIFRTVKGVTLKPEQAQVVVDAITRRVFQPDGVRYGIQPANTLSWVMRQTNANKPDLPNIGWNSGQHTASPTIFGVYGRGIGAARIGLIDNTYNFTLMTRALGIRFQNPVMSEQEALEVLKSRAGAPTLHPEDVLA
ncbi:MAG: alkaline phosphatase [Meiothermus sp.]|uniref:alkaline phosphatase n=1 Tax=Meiothermus sp. TaxID=1955249 RepID=UPI0025DB513B|nr:alkaline phosphatase [Meiothermus sp.]MCS7057617.1 alkaline phosphatase [Meiothermus sp.]MDW8480829.1 alkaline phosphatase [Meiothermus sp.]